MGQTVPTIQYPGLAEPIPFADAPTVTIDAWLASYPDILRREPRAIEGGMAAPPFVPDVTDPAPPFKPPVYPDRIPRTTMRAALQVAQVQPVFVPDVTQPVPDLSWEPVYPDRVPGRRPNTWAAPQVAPIYVPDVTVVAPLLSWQPRYDDRVVRTTMRVALQQSLAWPPFVPDTTQPVTPLSWAPQYPDRIPRGRMLAALQLSQVAPLFVADVTDPAPLLSWSPRHPDWLARRLFLTALQQPLALNPTTPAPVVVPDLAPAVYPDRVYGKPPLRQEAWWDGPLYVPDVTDPAPLYKVPVYPDFIVRRRYPAAQQQALALPLFVPDVTTPAPDLSWQPSYLDRYRQRLMPVAQQQFLAWGFVAPAPTPAPDFVGVASPDPVRRQLLRPPSGGVAPLYVPDVTVVVPPLSWKPQFPDRIYRKKMLPAQQQTLGWNVDTPPVPGPGQPPGCVTP